MERDSSLVYHGSRSATEGVVAGVLTPADREPTAISFAGVSVPGYKDCSDIVLHRNLECFQIFDDGVFLRLGELGAIGGALVAGV